MTTEPTTRRASISLTFATDTAAGEILQRVIEEMSPYLSEQLEGTSAHAFDLDDPDLDGPLVQLVVHPDGRPPATFIDDLEGATGHAASIGGIVATIPITHDHDHRPAKEQA